MSRMPSTALLLASSGVLAWGCGGHSSRGPAAARTNAGPAPGHGAPLSRRQAVALARAVNLTAGDVPGFAPSTSKRERSTSSEEHLEHKMMRCAGASFARAGLADASSKSFERRRSLLQQSVNSEVSVANSRETAAKELAEIRGARVPGCIAHFLELLLRSRQIQGVSVGPVSVAQGTPPAAGASGSFGWRMTASFTVQRLRIPIYLDILGFTYGPAQVKLLASGFPAPFPAAVEERLFTLLLRRTETYQTRPR